MRGNAHRSKWLLGEDRESVNVSGAGHGSIGREVVGNRPGNTNPHLFVVGV